jgi:predicted aldo/keto reductase-like oxidoreductase
MYYNSFKELQVDYIDYMMLHGVGMDFLDSTAQKFVRYPLIPCNDCKYCMPCPYGIDIPGILSHFNKCINEDLMPVSSQDENYRELRRAFLIGYDRSVPKLRQADHCVGCDQCIRKCPQRINIPKQMRRIDKFVEALKQGKEFDDKTNYLWSR